MHWMHFVVKGYRVIDEKSIVKFKELMVEYATIEKKVKPIIQKCLEGMERAAKAIDPKLVSYSMYFFTFLHSSKL